MRFYDLTLGLLAVWRVTHLLNAEDGPWDILVRLRKLVGSGFLGSLLDCFYCLSLWVAAPFALLLGETWRQDVLLWLALSGGGILLERVTAAREGTPYYREAPEVEHELLRQEESKSGGSIEPQA